ncbi:MAG: SRPBCC domain-containing protein [Chloroflexi bacterium]|nr:SRPBCC domain-containing protein [Chloroflexota bacterium]
MAKRLRTEIEISATPERVWDVLMDFDSYPEWNPFVKRIAGEASEGSRLEVGLELPGGRGMTFRPSVAKVEPNREFRWLGHFLMPGIADGEHSFVIEPLDGGRVRFRQEERFTGVLTPLFLAIVGERTHQGFDEMNRALKQRVEAGG